MASLNRDEQNEIWESLPLSHEQRQLLLKELARIEFRDVSDECSEDASEKCSKPPEEEKQE
jgi:hypothetical protein